MRVLPTLVLLFVCPALVLAEDAPPAADASGPKEAEEGFVSIFNGKNLDGWLGATQGYGAEDGMLVCKKHGGGNLFTKKEYGDFVFRFEFKLEPGGNNGVALRSPLEGNPAYEAMECQILDDSAEAYKKALKPWQFHGSIYGVVPAKTGHLKPVGEWNSQEIVCQGSKVKVTLNGAVIVDTDLATLGDEMPDGNPHPGLHRKKGHLGFLGHGHRIELRNLRVKDL
ncbi:MAG: DUF1080 domain-containing protein [Pirellulales bacterium]|nr:DUF1080 domain-containing protein [Pirellulales bacterium]